jgi:agmatine deiminase
MMDRRTLVGSIAALAATMILPACEPQSPLIADSPLKDYEMPLESEPHERTFMQWPVNLDIYDRASLARTQVDIARIANTIAQFEPVVMLADTSYHSAARKLLGSDVELWDMPTDDLWCRDSGPTFVRKGEGELAVSDFHFNGWGNKQPHANDALIARRIAERLGLPLLDTGLVGEQGGLEHDGEGTVLAHASSWVNPNRNRLTEAEISKRLLQGVGARKMIWAPGIAGKDITDYHIDALARFVGPGKVLIQIGATIDRTDPWSIAGHETQGILKAATDAKGRKIEVVALPDPIYIRARQPDFVASYVNYYVCNQAVIAAQFGDKAADTRARDMLQSLYPDRTIMMINTDAIGESGGGIHCATQHQPKAIAA